MRDGRGTDSRTDGRSETNIPPQQLRCAGGIKIGVEGFVATMHVTKCGKEATIQCLHAEKDWRTRETGRTADHESQTTSKSSLRPHKEAYQWTSSLLFWVMACSQLSTRPIPEPMHAVCQMVLGLNNSSQNEKIFFSRKCIWKCLQNVCNFIQASMG